MVITKGADVLPKSARFCAGRYARQKQMAIDADLNAGLIGEEQRPKRRSGGHSGSRLLRLLDGRGK